MGTELSRPLADIVKRAKKLPVTGAVAAERQRVEHRFARAGKGKIVLCDCSGSMLSYAGNFGMSKQDALVIALRDVLARHPDATIVTFGSTAQVVQRPEDVTAQSMWGTALAAALEFCATMNPGRTIVITDGEPTDGGRNNENCYQAAEALPGRIDTIYCGPDSSPAAVFLASLAKSGCGKSFTADNYGLTELAAGICALLE